MSAARHLTPGQYLGHRLLELGCDTVFTVPGDFNLPVLDALAMVPGLRIVNCNSELACAYAADGFARAKPGSLGCCITTFLVGALSAINGVAGSFAEELPVLAIVGVPATRQYGGMCSLHHTLGNAEDMSQEVACYRPVTCYQTILRNFTDARYLIDKALTQCMARRKPVLLEVCRDIPMTPHASFGECLPRLAPFAMPRATSDPAALDAAVGAVQRFFADKAMPVIVAGRRIRTCGQALVKLADALGWGVILLHDAKGMFPETHPAFIGIYSPFYTDPASIKQTLDAADGVLFVGTHFNEMSFGGAPDEGLERRSVLAYKQHVLVAHNDSYTGVVTEEVLLRLAGSLEPSSAAVKLFHSLPALPPQLPSDPAFTAPANAPLKMAFVMDQLQQQLLSGEQDMAVMVDTGDSMFRTQGLKLPAHTPYEVQMFAGNIGYAPPAGLGFSLGSTRRLLVIGGDGGLQMTSGSIGDYVKCGSNAIFVCVNNDGYLIERYISPISEAPYNYVARWDYAMLAEAMCNKQGKYRVFKVRTDAEAAAAIAAAKDLSDHFVFIEVIVDPHDATPAAAAMRAGFVAKHFGTIEGYQHLNLTAGASAAAGGSSLTGHQHGGAGDEAASGGSDGAVMPIAAVGAAARASPGVAGAAAAAGFGLGPARAMHQTAGSSSCLVPPVEAPLAPPAGGTGAGASRLGVLPAKRPAEADLDADRD